MNNKLYIYLQFISNTYFITNSDDFYNLMDRKKIKGKLVDVRTEKKIGRNEICPKCDSGLKYKKCCGK